MDYFRIIKMNHVPLLVYRNGEIYRIKNNGYKIIENTKHKCNYNLIKLNYKLFYRHRILGYAFLNLDLEDEKQMIDHIDGNTINNDVRNLRRVTRQENAFNSHKAKGYSYDKIAKSFKTYIHINHKLIYLGHFKTEIEARMKYLSAKQKYHIINTYS